MVCYLLRCKCIEAFLIVVTAASTVAIAVSILRCSFERVMDRRRRIRLEQALIAKLVACFLTACMC